MLIVMHHGYVQFIFQTTLNFKAFRRFDVFQIYTSECGCNGLHGFYEIIHRGPVHFYVKYIYVCEGFEQKSLPFHHRLSGYCTDITQSKYGSPVTDNTH